MYYQDSLEYTRALFLEGQMIQPQALNIAEIEMRYMQENAIMQAIKSGSFEAVKDILNVGKLTSMARRHEDVLRDYKNNLIILNTILRKSAEYAAVHPLYIHELSGKYARKIEEQTNPQDDDFVVEMLRQYCELVQHYSLRGYSPIIQKVVNHINLNIACDLRLKSLAERFNISAGYLSALFKKEVGMTLTEYVNGRRIEQSLILLNTTSLQIQDIASCCGFTDSNYYSRLFKRKQGITPKKYQEMVEKKGERLLTKQECR